MKAINLIIEEIQEAAAKLFDVLDEKGHRKEWAIRTKTVKVLNVLKNHQNYALSSNLPNFPGNEDNPIEGEPTVS